MQNNFDISWNYVCMLVDKFLLNHSHYISNEYQEAQVRQDFIDKLFIGLGWDVLHENQIDPYRQEVKIERPEKKAKGRADYAFFIAPHFKRVRFFVEAKRPQLNIATADNCFQAIRYSWPQRLPLAVLTDFNNFYVIDTRFQPKIDSAESRIVLKWHCSDFKEKDQFSKLYHLFSRQAVERGSIEYFAENELPQQQYATKQYSLFAHEAREFDEVFLTQLDRWRQILATSFKKAKQTISNEQLTECVQRTLDRLVFIRFLEDKRIEPDHIIARFGQGNKKHWHDFIARCKSLDQVYNGIVFKPHSILDSRDFDPNSSVFAEICDDLIDDHSPYNFDSIPVEILGRIYERFLGKVLQSDSNDVEVVEKEDVRKAGGVFYTPDYIVAYMVEQSLGGKVKGKKPEDIISMRVIDTACGSGSFLIGVFGFLLEVMIAYYRKHPKSAKKGVLEMRGDELHLSLSYKREILKKCIYGVDIDNQAVEVAQLSLYLKLMEEETTNSAHQQQIEMGVALLPTLSSNIVVGNSLVTLNHESADLFSIDKIRAIKSLDFKSAFPDAFQAGGFDLVIGNPPYIKESTNRFAFENTRSSPYYQGKMDIWYLFACRGLDLLKQGTGILAYIATNNWVTNAGASLLRKKITKDARIKQLIDFGDYKVFRDAGIQTMILIAQRDQNLTSYSFDYRRLEGVKRSLADVQALLEKQPQDGCVYLEAKFDRDRDPHSPMTFSSGNVDKILTKIAEKRNFQLNERTEVAHGIDVLQDVVNIKNKEKLQSNIQVGDGIFVISDAEKQNMQLTQAENELVRPFYTTRELVRYAAISQNRSWIIYTSSKFKDVQVMKDFPNIKQHLDKYLPVLTSAFKPYGLHRARKEDFFHGEKILLQRKCIVPTFTYTDFDCYVSRMFIVIKSNRLNLHFLTALLNSRLVRFWLKNKGKMQGQNFQIDNEPLLSIPIFLPSSDIQLKLIQHVRSIIRIKKEFPKIATDAERDYFHNLIRQEENQIDSLIENSYELTASEKELLIVH